MRWLILLILWIAAVIVAVIVLRRVRRGKPVVLAGRWSPRLVRMVAVVLVVLGLGEEARLPEASGAPARVPVRSTDDELPKTITAETIQTWLTVHQEGGTYARHDAALARALMTGKPPAASIVDGAGPGGGAGLGLPVALQKLIIADLAAMRADKPLPPATAASLQDALDELEKSGRYDHFWNAYLWRKSAAVDAQARIPLYDRFRQYARITDALIRAHALVKPLMLAPRAWAGKAGRPPGWATTMQAHANSVADMLKVAAEVLPTTDEGTWKRDGVTLIKPVRDLTAPILIRGGKERVLPEDESTRFSRLDLLQTGDKPAAIAHDWLGKIELPANKLVSVWELPNLLSDAAKQKLDEAVYEALKTNSEEGADRLERCLAVSHQAIRVGLKELPNAKGAPRLRLILALFDDAVMPTLPAYRVSESPQAAGGFGRGPGGR